MKKIGIDARLYSQTGVGTYLHNLLHYLDEKNPKNERYFVYFRKQDGLKVKLRFKSKNIIIRIADQKWHSFSEQTKFLFLILKDNLDLMHFTYFSYPIFYWRKFIATVHDVTPILYKTGKASTKNQFLYQIKHFIFRLVLNLQVKRAVKIITPTKTVKQELIKIYGKNIFSKIQPIYEGIAWKFVKLSKEHSVFNNKLIGKPFFIYVGNFYPHKNIEKLVAAFKNINKKYKLILLGPGDFFSKKILQSIDTLKLNKNILMLKDPTLSDLIFFYKNAEALIHPSLSEGFGLPLIEASYFNCPIIASNIEVFKELLGNNYLSFDPNDVNDIADKIKSFIEKKPKFDSKNIIKQYSFEKMTNETVKIYREVIYGNRQADSS